MREPTKLLIAGDWHGNAGWARTAKWNPPPLNGQRITTGRIAGLDCDGSQARYHIRIVTEKDFT